MQIPSTSGEINKMPCSVQKIAPENDINGLMQVGEDCEIRFYFDPDWEREFAPKYRDILGFSPSSQLGRYSLRQNSQLGRETGTNAAMSRSSIDKGHDFAQSGSGRFVGGEALNIDTNARPIFTQVIRRRVYSETHPAVHVDFERRLIDHSVSFAK
jgi:hypothetical protein